MVSTLKVNGSRGEITPLMHSRVDTDFYQEAYAQCLNTVITRYGPHTRVPGTWWFGAAKFPDRKAKNIPFEFSETQVYALEFGHQYVRFWTRDGQVVSGGVPYEIVTGYAETDLPYLHARQSGDALYLFCTGKRPMVLKRLGETNWTLTQYKPKDGPYLGINDTPTTMLLGNTGNIVPLMTSNTAPAPIVVATSHADPLDYVLFRRTKNEILTVSGTFNDHGEIRFDLGVGNSAVLDNYFLMASSNNAQTDAMFSQWDLQGSNDGTSWVTLDSRDSEKGWAGSETRYHETNNKVAFRMYRLLFSGGGGSTGGVTQAGGWYMHRAADNQTPTTLTASSVTGINGDTGFKATDVGRPVRLQGSDGRWRWCEIAGYVSPTQVTVRVYGQSFLTTDPIQNWALGAWSDTNGWPRTGRFYEDRLALAGWPADPIGLALSVSAAYDDFRVSTPIVDDDAVTIRMTGGRLDTVQWLAEAGTLMAGTAGGLRSIGTRDKSTVLKNDNIQQKLETSTAASRVQPTSVESVSLFMDRLMRRLYELGYDYNSDGYVAREVSVLNDHLFEVGIERIDYVDAPYRFVVALRSDGKVVFFAYDREQKIAGGSLCDFGGFVEDVMVLPGETYPDVWMVIRRVRNGQTVRYVEKLAPFYNGRVAPGELPCYAACAVSYEGAVTGALSGLTMLAGRTVGIWADGHDIGNAVVSNIGGVTLPGGLTAARIVVGERMPWRLQGLPLPVINNPNGNGLGMSIRIAKMTVDLFESARVYAGSLMQTDLLRREDESEIDPDAPEQIRTALFVVPTDDSWNNGGVFVIEGDSMFPATVRGVSLEIEMEP